jgi:hypothetical protein
VLWFSIISRKRLLEGPASPALQSKFEIAATAVAGRGDGDDSDLRVNMPQLANRCQPFLLRHQNVGDHQVATLMTIAGNAAIEEKQTMIQLRVTLLCDIRF